MAEVRIHSLNDQASAEAAAGRLHADGIPARLQRQDVGPPYGGMGLALGFDVLVPSHLADKARRSLGITEREPDVDRRGYYALIVLVVVALIVAALGLVQRLG